MGTLSESRCLAADCVLAANQERAITAGAMIEDL